MREIIISECMDLLTKYDFIVSQSFSRSCFDILARKDDEKYLIKVLKNIDSLSHEQSMELIKISRILNAIPLLIGVRTRNVPMENDVVYERHNVKAITLGTFKLYLEGSPPIIYAGRGGFFVNIDGEALKEIREKLNISVGELAEFSNVSRKAIYKYEQNKANPSIEVALKIEQYLDAPLVKGIPLELNYNNGPLSTETNNEDNIYNKYDKYDKYGNEHDNNSSSGYEEEFKMHVMKLLDELGFNMIETKKAPFDAVAEKHDIYEYKEYNINALLLTNIEETETEETRKKALIVNKLSSILNSHSLLILEKGARDIGNIKTISIKELEKMDDAFELFDYLINKSRNTSSSK
ncbi:transcriptional regulator [Methanothermococcus okinawensis]|uniref:Putative HTH-type transcriptional regulatory protein Metok_1392 n=1 Tax=Methanothermococcus okinawensis (strain DSM 14208 / JCM 11175 / IH1) TaxID=647113 RepID=F8AK01_METOI|nr:transcriptional regulator [Methanothermococcus okinawensis]AEH07357.1 transcriptional regulator, XRE family [Methanothermococcus okinawensis IH1]